MKNGLISIMLGVIILAGIVFKMQIGLNQYVEIIFGAIFVISGLEIFKKVKGEYLGHIFFGAILLADAFNLFSFDLKFYQLILLMIASYMLSSGIVTIFKRGDIVIKTKKHDPHNHDKRLEMSVPKRSDKEVYAQSDFDWTKLTGYAGTLENDVAKIKIDSDKDIFSKTISWNNEQIKITNKLKVSNIKVPERASAEVKIDKLTDYIFDFGFSVSDALIDLRNSKTKSLKINSSASKIVFIPPDSSDSSVDADLEITSLTIRLPKNVGLVLNHTGELNFKSFEGFSQKEDGTYVSNNYSESLCICYLNISSDMSRLSVQII